MKKFTNFLQITDWIFYNTMKQKHTTTNTTSMKNSTVLLHLQYVLLLFNLYWYSSVSKMWKNSTISQCLSFREIYDQHVLSIYYYSYKKIRSTLTENRENYTASEENKNRKLLLVMNISSCFRNIPRKATTWCSIPEGLLMACITIVTYQPKLKAFSVSKFIFFCRTFSTFTPSTAFSHSCFWSWMWLLWQFE